jgi:hypothetical protein
VGATVDSEADEASTLDAASAWRLAVDDTLEEPHPPTRATTATRPTIIDARAIRMLKR